MELMWLKAFSFCSIMTSVLAYRCDKSCKIESYLNIFFLKSSLLGTYCKPAWLPQPRLCVVFFGTRGSRLTSCVWSQRRFFLFVFFFKSTKHVLLWQILNAMTHLAEIRVSEPQNNFKNNSTNFTRGRMGQIPVIRCFVQNFYMVAYVTKAGLGPEPF